MKKELLKNNKSIKNKAFTLIELLVVIAIIGILTAIVSANLASSKIKARDAKRISDIGQLQLTLELYFDRCNSYPATLDTSGANCSAGVNLGTFISIIPKDPKGNAYGYTMSGFDYVLSATLENSSNMPDGDLDGTILGVVDCTDPVYCVQSK